MPKLSRLQRYQVLRDRLDEETSESQQEQNKQSLQRLSRVANKDTNALSHASDPRKSSIEDDQPVQTISSNLPKSPVMDDLIDEVKQYNLDAGNTIWDDTQFNILKQLDETQARHRSQHFVPMEEQEDDDLGSTMQLPITKIKAIDELAKTKNEEETKETVSDEVNGPTILPMSKTPLPFYPIEEEKEEQSEDKIILSQEDFVEDDIESTFERLTPLEAYKRPEHVDEQENKDLEDTKKQPVIKKKEKVKTENKKERKKEIKKQEAKKPEKKKEKKPFIKKATPVVKQAEVKVEKQKKDKPDASHILNIVLVVLIILLFIAILATVLMMRSLTA